MPTATCSRDDCDRVTLARGLCASHYRSDRVARLRAGARSGSRPCVVCGADLAGMDPRRRFCSTACKDDYYAAEDKAAVRVRRSGRTCVVCGGELPTTRSSKAVTCSKQCADSLQNGKKQAAARQRWLANRKPCPQCGKDLSEDAPGGSIYCSWSCKHAAMGARYRSKNPGYMRSYLYGITAEQYDAMWKAQGERCAICRTAVPGGKGGWHLDHDHATGAVRGLLCHYCNLMLGHAKDDPSRLRAAAAYLERAP